MHDHPKPRLEVSGRLVGRASVDSWGGDLLCYYTTGRQINPDTPVAKKGCAVRTQVGFF